MPDPIERSVNVFMVEIKAIEESLLKEITAVSRKMASMTDTQLINATRQLNFLQELVDRGYGSAVNDLMDDYDTLLAKAVREAKRRGIDPLKGASVETLQTLKDLDTASLLGRAEQWGNQMKSAMFSSIYGGQPIRSITAVLAETGLATHQLNVSAYTAMKQFDDLSRYAVFKGEDVKWTYIGPQDKRTRPQCEATAAAEPSDGYTESAVSSDTRTPFGIRGGFNCRHSWMVK
jgi:hypothetical protein